MFPRRLKVPILFLLFSVLTFAVNLRAQPGTMGLGADSNQQSGNFNPSGLPNPDIDMSGGPSSQASASRPPIFVTGTVTMDDGSPLPPTVNILSVCATKQRTVAHVGSGGAFSFQWNSATTIAPEAADDGGRSHSGTGMGVGMGELGV